MDDTPSTSKRKYYEGDAEEAELSLGNTRQVKRKPRGRGGRQSTRGGLLSPSSSVPSSSREPSVVRSQPTFPLPNRNRNDPFLRPTEIPRWSQQTAWDGSESDMQSEGSQITPWRQHGKKMTDEERRRRAAERMRLARQKETPAQREERKRKDREMKKWTRALEIQTRIGILKDLEDVSTQPSTATSRDPSEERQPVTDDLADWMPPSFDDELVDLETFVDFGRPAEGTSRQRTEAERKYDSRQLESDVAREARLQAEKERSEAGRAKETQRQELARLAAQRDRSAARILSETSDQRRARQEADRLRSEARMANETSEERRARQEADNQRFADRVAKETPEQRRARLDYQFDMTSNRRLGETTEQHQARIDAVNDRRKERERAEDVAERRRQEDAARQKRVRDRLRNAQSSDSEDGEDHIQSPQVVDPLDIGPRWTCPDCGAEIFGKDQFCCSNGQDVVPPEVRPPNPIDELIYGNGPDSKEFKKKILNYGSAFGIASLQRKNEPVAKHGLPVAKVQGAVDAYPSSAFPYGNNQEAFGNIFVYEGKEATEMRLKYGHELNRKLVERIQPAFDKYNVLGKQYKNMKEVMNELNPNDPNEKSSAVRLKIINAWHVDASKLQGHKGIYRTENQGSNDYIAVFYRASVEQGDIDLPGLIVYPYRSKRPMMPINYWDPLVEPLCYTLLRPYGEYGFVPKKYPKKSEKVHYWKWLADWLKANPEQAKKSDLKLTAREIFEKAGTEDVPAEYIIHEGTVEMDHDNIRDYQGPGTSQQQAQQQQQDDEDERQVERLFAGDEGYFEMDPLERIEAEESRRLAKMHDAERVFEEEEEPEEPVRSDTEDEGPPNAEEIAVVVEDQQIPAGNLRDSTGRQPDQEYPQDAGGVDADSDSLSDEDDNDDEGGRRKSKKRKWMSQREYLVYLYQNREHLENRYLNSGKLGQLFLIHGLTRILRGRAEKYRKFNTMKIKTTKMKFLRGMERKAAKKGYQLGVATLMPRSVAGSPRWLQAKFENAVALANRLGKIDLFITATCNVNWPEIKNNLKNGQTWADNPFLVNNVFYEKWKKLKDLLLGKKNAVGKRPGGIFGKHRWYSGSIEFQSRGPPHIHLVVSLKHHIKTTAQIDKVCQAFFPNDPVLCRLVEEFMVHSPCQNNPKAYCREELKNKNRAQCKKNFPKDFSETTKFGDRTYPELKRPDDGHCSSKNRNADNRWIVPYNGTLLSAWRGHLNIEVVSTVKVVKYIFKYIFKGFDRVLVQTVANTDGLNSEGMTIDGHLIYPKGLKIPPGELEKRKRAAVKVLTENGVDLTDKNGKPTLVYDETVIIQDMRVLTSCEAAWILAKYPRHLCSHTVIYESVHEEDHEPLLYKEEDEEKVKETIDKTGFPSKLKAWFRLNQEDEDARDLTFQEIPYFYTYRNGKWVKKKRIIRDLIARIQSVPPSRREAFAIRLLCQTRKGITSFKDLRSVDGKTYNTYTEAAKALGIMDNQQEWNDCMAEAAVSVSPSQLRRLFMQILTNNIVLDPLSIYLDNREFFWENKKWPDAMKEAHALYHMRSYLKAHGKILADFEDVIEENLPPQYELYDDSGRRPFSPSTAFAARLRRGLKDEQSDTFEEIFSAVKNGIKYGRKPDEKSVFFLQGSGGVGKTVLMKALYYNLLAEGKNVACVAHTGIAASLLPGGQTAHRLFHIPLLQDDTMNCQVEQETDDADYLRQFHCIIWDEATMTDTRIFEAVHRLLVKLNQSNDNNPFGGTFLVLAGDWKQTLPIDPEARSVGIVDRTLLHWDRTGDWVKFFQLTKNRRTEDPAYAAYLEDVGMATLNMERGIGRPEDELVELPTKSIVHSEREVIQKVFGNKGSPAEKFDSFKDSAILAVDNNTTFDINDIALDELLDTPEHTFRSIDTYDETKGLAALDPENYHRVTPPGMPPHELRLKVGAVVILLRNINVALGLTNGTRLVVTKIGDRLIHVKHVHPRKNQYGNIEEEEDIVLGKMLFGSSKPTSRELSFTRRQFPLRLAFAITVNRAQGQTLDRAGLILRSPCFSHGQLYVALSRVRTPTKLFIHNSSNENPYRTNNVVYPQVVNALKRLLANAQKGHRDATPDANAESMEIGPPRGLIGGPNPYTYSNEDIYAFIERSLTENDDDWLYSDIVRREPRPVAETPMEVDSDSQYAVEVRPQQPQVPQRPSAVRDQSTRGTRGRDVLRLKNDWFYCFANTAVQVLHRLFYRDIMMDHTSRSQALSVLQQIFFLNQKDVKNLLAVARGPDDDPFDKPGVQHDAEEYLRYLLDILPQHLKESMKFKMTFKDTCCACQTVTGRNDEDTEAYVHSTEKGHPFNFYLRSCETGDLEKECAVCGIDTKQTFQGNVEIPEKLRYLRLTISRLRNANDPNSVIRRKMQAPLNTEIAFGYRWKPVVMVEYQVMTNEIRHYAVYKKSDEGWLRISDSETTQLDGPPDMSDISMVIMEKLEKVPERRSPLRELIPNFVSAIRDKVRITKSNPKPKPTPSTAPVQPNQPARKKIALFHGNLLDKSIQADVVVNAANPRLQNGGGVCGDVFRKAGVKDLEKECEKAAETLQGGVLQPGQAVATHACRMKPPVKWIVHTAAPNLNASGRTMRPDTAAEENLRMCYIHSCLRADEKGGKRVVFPVLGIGIYGYDQRQGIAVAIQSFYAYFEAYPQTGIESITLAILGDGTYNQAKSLMNGINSVEFKPREAKPLRLNFEHFYDNRPRPQDIQIPGTSVNVSSFVSNLKVTRGSSGKGK